MNAAGGAALTDTDRPAGAAALLRSTATIRARSGQLLQRARTGDSPCFTLHDNALPDAAALVADLTRTRFPDLAIPYHSRWRHFEAGGIDRRGTLSVLAGGQDLSTMIDLTIVSVLLDAGAGPTWRYREADTGQSFGRSEGLGVASWHAFTAGLFSSDPDRPLQVDADGLAALTVPRLAAAFQVSPDNPLVGLEGRVAVLHRLGATLAARPTGQRPAAIFDALAGTDSVRAHDILSLLLTSLSDIWLADNDIGGERLGDCWPHPAVRGPGLSDGWVPFHKLSQWLTYSLLEPFEWAGVRVTDLGALTGLPEYRNGGLLLDTGVLQLRDSQAADGQWAVSDELVVEWRALTVALLDALAPLVREHLGADDRRMPLACVLEGGTWAAGRATAQRLRGGRPPLHIISDGTVF